MPVRVTFHELDAAGELVTVLTTAGYEAGVSQERFAGEDDGEEIVHVVHTDAPAAEVDELVADSGGWVEESSPLPEIGDATELPAQPRR